MSQKKMNIAILLGDPSGIGPELVSKLLSEEITNKANIVVIGEKNILEQGNKISEKSHNLNFEESKSIFETIMSGQAKDDHIYDFLTLLSAKGESPDEIAGGVFVLRNKAKPVNIAGNVIDTCGTGGDGKNTLNISTASALLLASYGIKVSKHGNKAVSSKCGSADVLEKLKININLEPKQVEESINKTNFGFMFAPNYHSAMKYVGPIRKKIGKRTIFNLIGPLSNPAKVKRQVIGVFSKNLLTTFAKALQNLKSDFVWIVNSEDGLDEISPYDKTKVVQLKNNSIKEFTINPSELGIKTNNFEKIVGKESEYNSEKIIEIFKGTDNDFSVAVSLNAAAGLIVSDKSKNIVEAYPSIREHILSGKAFEHLNKITNL